MRFTVFVRHAWIPMPTAQSYIMKAVLVVIVFLGITYTYGRAEEHEQARETSRLLAILLIPGVL